MKICFCFVLLVFQKINVHCDDIEISLFDKLEINRVFSTIFTTILGPNEEV